MHDRRLRALGALAALAAVSSGEVFGYAELKTRLRDALKKDPIDSVLLTLVVGAWVFYLAEKGHNPKVTSLGDAFVFVSTCFSVGYADIIARTPVGKAVASAIMTVGPSMVASILEDPVDPVVERLDAILSELQGREAIR
ncbi:MAG: ion channel [Myxococcales bacterium]|jgi:hypothetical protein